MNAPIRSGVYALHHGTRWIYVGEASDILAQLIQHLHGDGVGITMFSGLTFSYELLSEVTRARRQAELIQYFRPICNPLI